MASTPGPAPPSPPSWEKVGAALDVVEAKADAETGQGSQSQAAASAPRSSSSLPTRDDSSASQQPPSSPPRPPLSRSSYSPRSPPATSNEPRVDDDPEQRRRLMANERLLAFGGETFNAVLSAAPVPTGGGASGAPGAPVGEDAVTLIITTPDGCFEWFRCLDSMVMSLLRKVAGGDVGDYIFRDVQSHVEQGERRFYLAGHRLAMRDRRPPHVDAGAGGAAGAAGFGVSAAATVAAAAAAAAEPLRVVERNLDGVGADMNRATNVLLGEVQRGFAHTSHALAQLRVHEDRLAALADTVEVVRVAEIRTNERVRESIDLQCVESGENEQRWERFERFHGDTVEAGAAAAGSLQALEGVQVLMEERAGAIEDGLGVVREEGKRTRENTISTATALADELKVRSGREGGSGIETEIEIETGKSYPLCVCTSIVVIHLEYCMWRFEPYTAVQYIAQ